MATSGTRTVLPLEPPTPLDGIVPVVDTDRGPQSPRQPSIFDDTRLTINDGQGRGLWGNNGQSARVSPEPLSHPELLSGGGVTALGRGGRSETLAEGAVTGLVTRLAQELESGSRLSAGNTVSPTSETRRSVVSPPFQRPAELGSAPSTIPPIKARCGTVICHLPCASKHSEYLDFYFDQINPFHPCLNENETRQRVRNLFSYVPDSPSSDTVVLPSSLTPLLAMLFSIYALCEAVSRSSMSGYDKLPNGYEWYRQSQALIGKRQTPTSTTDITGIQILTLQVRSLSPSALTLGPCSHLHGESPQRLCSRWSCDACCPSSEPSPSTTTLPVGI